MGQNLVSNSSFEILNSCGSGPSAIKNLDAPPWESPTDNTADVFDTCSTFPAWSVPSNFAGNQNPHLGHAYAGACFYPSPEYLEIALDSPMVAGNIFCVSFYINLGGKVGRATKNTGVYISASHIYNSGMGYLSYTPQIIDTTFISDTTNWTLISGQYTSIGGERYILIGKFSSSLSDTMHVNPGSSNPIAYYYIDDVDVHCCSSNCTIGVTNLLQTEEVFILFPNPAQNEISIHLKFNSSSKTKLEIFNSLGKTVYSSNSFIGTSTIDISNLPKGIYMLYFQYDTKRITKTFIKQ